MTTSKERAARIVPELLRRERAASYLDVSGPVFDRLVKSGIFPPARRVSETLFAWRRSDLDAAIDSLPFVGGPQDSSWND